MTIFLIAAMLLEALALAIYASEPDKPRGVVTPALAAFLMVIVALTAFTEVAFA